MPQRAFKLNQPPQRSNLRSLGQGLVARGIEPSGGQFGAGLILGVSAIARGEALGHDFWIDDIFLASVAGALSAAPNGLKSRFTHPSLSADGLAKGLGLVMTGAVEGDCVRTDLHFYASAHRSPDGDLAGYVLTRAAEDPANFGTSIVFSHDPEAEKALLLAHGGVVVVHEDYYGSYETIEGFVSPDPLNVDHLPHARLSALHAVDLVDSPAANPDGLFHRDLTTVNAASEFLDFALGLSAKTPQLAAFDIDPERARLFVQRYANERGLDLQTLRKGSLMPKLKMFAEDTPGAPPAADPKSDCTCPKPDAAASDKPAEKEDPKAELGRFVTLFGAEKGTAHYLAGTTFEAAKSAHITALTADNKALKDRLASLGKAGTEPLGFSAAPDPDRKPSGKTAFQSLFKHRGTVASTN